MIPEIDKNHPQQTQWSHWAMLQQLWGSYAKLRRNSPQLRKITPQLRTITPPLRKITPPLLRQNTPQLRNKSLFDWPDRRISKQNVTWLSKLAR